MRLKCKVYYITNYQVIIAIPLGYEANSIKREQKLLNHKSILEKKVNNKNYIQKAPLELVQKDRDNLSQILMELNAPKYEYDTELEKLILIKV